MCARVRTSRLSFHATAFLSSLFLAPLHAALPHTVVSEMIEVLGEHARSEPSIKAFSAGAGNLAVHLLLPFLTDFPHHKLDVVSCCFCISSISFSLRYTPCLAPTVVSEMIEVLGEHAHSEPSNHALSAGAGNLAMHLLLLLYSPKNWLCSCCFNFIRLHLLTPPPSPPHHPHSSPSASSS